MNDPKNRNPADIKDYLISKISSITRDLEGQSRTILKALDSLDELESRYRKLSSLMEEKIRSMEIELEKCNMRKSTADSELSRLGNEVESLKKAFALHVKNPPAQESQQEVKRTALQNQNTALLPGKGFSAITPEYLKSLKNK